VLRLNICGPQKQQYPAGPHSHWAHHAGRWSEKAEQWEAKRLEKLSSDPELCQRRIVHIENKKLKLEERKAWLLKKTQEVNPPPHFAHRLAHVTMKLNRIDSFLVKLKQISPVGQTPVPTSASAPAAALAPAPAATPIPVSTAVQSQPTFTPPVTETDLVAAKEIRAGIANTLNEIHLKIEMKKK